MNGPSCTGSKFSGTIFNMYFAKLIEINNTGGQTNKSKDNNIASAKIIIKNSK